MSVINPLLKKYYLVCLIDLRNSDYVVVLDEIHYAKEVEPFCDIVVEINGIFAHESPGLEERPSFGWDTNCGSTTVAE